MNKELLADVKVSLFMNYYIEESIDLFGEELSTKLLSPARKGLQNIYYSFTILYNKDTHISYSIVAKLLWVEKGEVPTLIPPYCSCEPEVPIAPRRTRQN